MSSVSQNPFITKPGIKELNRHKAINLDKDITMIPAIIQLQPNPLSKKPPVIIKNPIALMAKVISHRRIVTNTSTPKSFTITSFGKIIDDPQIINPDKNKFTICLIFTPPLWQIRIIIIT